MALESTKLSTDPIRVMVVDDSAVVRGLISRMLESDPAIDVVATVGNGEQAVKKISTTDVDVIILDIEMPVMDGLTALPKLLEIDRGVKIIMASTLTLKNAEVSMRALQAGAADYVPKPTTAREISGGDSFKRELLEKVKALGAQRIKEAGDSRAPGKPIRAKAPAISVPKSGPITLRKPGLIRPDILAIGSSTGGPQALFNFLKNINVNIARPILITQHMPATFTTILAEHITRMTGWPCSEGKEGEVIVPGRIYLAPGEYHMQVGVSGKDKVIRLNQDPPINFCRPAVDPMLLSIVKAYHGNVLTVILTGMGADGREGAREVVNAGGTVVAQDEESSVVWGMPGAVAEAGLCSAVLPLDRLAAKVTEMMK